MKLFELTIDDNQDEVFAISLVENPAIESDFIYFGKEAQMFASVDNSKRTLIGPILIPDKKILRVEADGSPYEVFFTKDTVQKLAQQYLKDKYTDSTTLEHDGKIKGVSLVESWIKEGKINDKSNLYGLNLPVGSWVGMFKVDNSPAGNAIWDNYVKTGKVKGFSIEGLFSHKLVEAAAIVDEELIKILKAEIGDINLSAIGEKEAAKVLSKIKHLIKSDRRFKKKQRVDKVDMDGEGGSAGPSFPGGSSYPGEAAKKVISPSTIPDKTIGNNKKTKTKKLAQTWSEVFANSMIENINK